MKKKKKKYYYVWEGHQTGYLDTNWDSCEKSVTGYPGNQFLSFDSKLNAIIASKLTYEEALLRRKNGEL